MPFRPALGSLTPEKLTVRGPHGMLYLPVERPADVELQRLRHRDARIAVLVAAKGSVPRDGLSRLEGLLGKALATEAVRTRFQALGVAPVILGREATARFLEREIRRYAQVIEASGIKAE